MKTKETNQVTIDLDNVTLRFGKMEPVVIPRSAVRTRLRLIDWVYRLTGWPGMKVQYLREFVTAIYRHHGWALPNPEEDPHIIGQRYGGGLATAASGARSPLTSEDFKVAAGFHLQPSETRKLEARSTFRFRPELRARSSATRP